MSQDHSTTTNTQEIDLDDVEVEILIVAKNVKPLAQAGAFLTRRGWPTSAVSNLAQAIEIAAEKKPDFVLVSLNHQNPAMPKFIDLVQTTFNSTVVAFVEKMDTASNQKLSKSQFKYKVFGQMSGPNLHRSIRRILAEKFNLGGEEHKPEEAKRDSRSGEDKVSVKSGGKDKNSVVIQQSDGQKQGKATVHIKSGPADDADGGIESQEVLATDKYKMGRANRRSLKDLAASQGGEQQDTFIAPSSGKGSKDLAAQLKNSLFGDKGADGGADESDSGFAYAGGSEEESSARAGSNGKAGKKLRDLESHQALNSSSTSSEQASKDQGFTAVDDLGRVRSARRSAAGAGLSTPTAESSIIEQAVEAALAQICQPGDRDPQTVGKIENVGVFPIDSPSMPGYLVLCWPDAEPRAEEAFFQLAQESLRNVFQESGVLARIEQGFFVQIPQVDFAQWTSEATFNLRLSHRDRELAVAFFKLSNPLPKAQPVEGNQMFSIGVQHISTERPVTFKAYLHLKKNNKYFLYLRNGRQLQPEQQERLKESKVKDFYMKSVDIENLRAFLAASHLTKTIKKSSGGNGNGSKAA